MEDGGAELEEALNQLRAAAEVHASLAAQRSSSGTGEMLRSNFVVVADLVEEQDGHLLTSGEKARTAEFKVRSCVLSCLFVAPEMRSQTFMSHLQKSVDEENLL